MYRTSLFDLEYSHACIVVVSVRVHFTVVVVVVVVVDVDDEPASPASMTDDGRSSVGTAERTYYLRQTALRRLSRASAIAAPSKGRMYGEAEDSFEADQLASTQYDAASYSRDC